ncbi:MAG: anti-sigma factor antagonist [Firmicutes bacterium]|nr:anti-sigma factor antagonist [Bacillota bacterium]MDY5676440.1 anti-sigma factor antagonist [Eubacteriales bacterium]
MDVKFNLLDDTLIVKLVGELDDCSAGYVRQVLDDALKKYTYNDVVFDMSELDFMDSTGIGVLIGRYKYLKNKNKNTYISNPSSTVDKIFRMSGIFEIMPKIS